MSQMKGLWAVIALAGAASALGLAQLVKRMRLTKRTDFFRGKVILLTGASRGIGRALALELAQRGARLVLASRDVDGLEQVAAACRAESQGVEILVLPTDVTQDDQLTLLVNATLDRYGKIDILVNNAGIIQGGAVERIGPDSLRRQIEVNLLAAMRLTQLVLPHMTRRREGLIAIMASAAGRHVVPYFVPYGVSKFGLHGFSEGLRRELMGSGVRVLLINPGFTQSDVVKAVGDTYRRMGFRIESAERVAARAVEAMALGRREANIGLIEYLGGWANRFFPRLADLFWRVALPADFPETAFRQRTE